MISLIATLPESVKHRRLLERWITHASALKTILLETPTTADVNAAIRQCTSECVLLIDGQTLLRGPWHHSKLPSGVDIVGGLCQTYAGLRIGYALNRSAQVGLGLRRYPLALEPGRLQKDSIDLPNDGALLIRRTLFDQLGEFNVNLPSDLACLDWLLRAIEQGARIGYHDQLFVERAAGVLESSLADDERFDALRSPQQWLELLQGPVRRAPFHQIELIAHGSKEQRRLQRWLRLAGYPVQHAVVAEDADAPILLAEGLAQRQRWLVCVDLRAEPKQDWLLSLVEATAGERQLGVVTCGTHGQAQRVLSADATATLLLTTVLPAQIRLQRTAPSFDAVIAELSQKAASFGIATRVSALQIERMQGWSEQYADVHTMEAQLNRSQLNPTISLVLLAGATASVHRFTTDALRSASGEIAELAVVVRSDAPKITARLRNQQNVRLFIDPDNELANHAFSRALSSVSGEFVVVMRDDFLVAEKWLSSLCAHLERLPGVGIVVPRMSAVPGTQNCENEVFGDSLEFRLAAERRRQQRAREAQLIDFFQMPSFVMRRVVLETLGGFDPHLATSHYGMIDYCLRARSVGFDIALADDVFVHRIPFEHTHSPFDQLVADSQYQQAFARKWRCDPENMSDSALAKLIGTPLAARHQFVMLESEPHSDHKRQFPIGQERIVFLLPVRDEASWQQAGQLIRKYLETFTVNDLATLAIGREDGLRTHVITQRIRQMIRQSGIDEASVPDIVIADAHDRAQWLAAVPPGPQYVLVADEALEDLRLLEDLSPSALRRTLLELRGSQA